MSGSPHLPHGHGEEIHVTTSTSTSTSNSRRNSYSSGSDDDDVSPASASSWTNVFSKKQISALLNKRSVSKIFTAKKDHQGPTASREALPSEISDKLIALKETNNEEDFNWAEYDKSVDATRKKLTPSRSLRTRKIKGGEGPVHQIDNTSSVSSIDNTTVTTQPQAQHVEDNTNSPPVPEKTSKKRTKAKDVPSPSSSKTDVKEIDWKSNGISVLNVPLDV
jgi:hypothetical protein